MLKLFLLFYCLLALHQVSGLDAEALSKDSKALAKFLNCLLETGSCSKEEAIFRGKCTEFLGEYIFIT